MPFGSSPAGYALQALANVLAGTGQGAQQADVLNQRWASVGQGQQALDLQRRQQDLQNAQRMTDVPALFKALGIQAPEGIGQMPTADAHQLAQIAEARRMQGVQEQRSGQVADALAQTHPELSQLVRSGVLGAKDVLPHILPQEKYTALPPGATPISNVTGQPPAGYAPPQRPEGPPPYDATKQRLSQTIDKNTGAVQYRVDDILPSEERSRLQEAQSRFPNDRGAQIAWLNQLAAQRAGGVAAAQAGSRPPTDQEQLAMQSHNQTLAALQQMKQFTPEEMNRYVGLLQRPGQEALMTLRGLPVVGGAFGQQDQRFADFKALMGKLQGTAFGEGGKQLTPFEASVVFSYTPTGKEPGGATEIQAKLRALESFTKMARNTRAELARTGRSAIMDPDALDAMLQRNMQGAGVAAPQTAPSAPNQIQNAPETKGRIRVRSKADPSRMGWINAGEPIPPDVEVVR